MTLDSAKENVAYFRGTGGERLHQTVSIMKNFIRGFRHKAYQTSLNSGILINPGPNSYFDYSQLDENWFKNLKDSLVRIPKEHESAKYWLDKAYALNEACKKFNISLKNAAIQFPYANPIVATCVLGMTSPSQVEENFNDYENKLPREFWDFLLNNHLIDKGSQIV
mgnify:CR=1 FL=1